MTQHNTSLKKKNKWNPLLPAGNVGSDIGGEDGVGAGAGAGGIAWFSSTFVTIANLPSNLIANFRIWWR